MMTNIRRSAERLMAQGVERGIIATIDQVLWVLWRQGLITSTEALDASAP